MFKLAKWCARSSKNIYFAVEIPYYCFVHATFLIKMFPWAVRWILLSNIYDNSLLKYNLRESLFMFIDCTKIAVAYTDFSILKRINLYDSFTF